MTRRLSICVPAEARNTAAAVLNTLAATVDQFIREGGEPNDPNIRDYLRNVERAASDVGARRERERVLDGLLSSLFGNGGTGASG